MNQAIHPPNKQPTSQPTNTPTGKPTGKPEKMITITAGSYAFSRYAVAVLIWLTLILQRREIMVAVFVLLLASALLSMRSDPLVMLYRQTIDRIKPSRPVAVESGGLRFAHALGTLFSVWCLILLYTGKLPAGWIVTGLFGIFKSVSALGYCPGLALYHLIRRNFQGLI